MGDQVSGKTAVDLAFLAYENGRRSALNELPKVREAIWPVQNGAVRLAFPSHMTTDDVETIDAYLRIWLTGLRRRAEAATQQPQVTPDDHSASVAIAQQCAPARSAQDEPNPFPEPDEAGHE